MMAAWKLRIIFLNGAALLCFVVGIGIPISRPFITKYAIKKMLPLELESDGTLSKTAKQWTDPSYAAAMQFWFFNVTNPNSVLYYGQKPSLVQLGPYGYREDQHKRHVEYFKNNTINYRNYKTYIYDKSLSCANCKESDMIVVPNMIYLTVANFISNSSLQLKKLIDLGLLALDEGPFTRQKAGDLALKGYDDVLVNLANDPIIKPLLKNFTGMNFLPKVGFFYGYNNSDDGLYQIGSGLGDLEELGQVKQWKGMQTLPETWWPGQYARMINGSDGTLYKPFLSKSDKPHVFASYLCRSFYVDFYREEKYRSMQAYHYKVPETAFDATAPENIGFNKPTNIRYYENQPNNSLSPGLMDLSECVEGNAPVLMSGPNFFGCPREVIESVDGLEPNAEEYNAGHAILEPTSGIPFSLSRRVQISVSMVQDNDITMLRNVKNVIFPILWVNETAEIDDENYDMIKHYLVTIPIICYVVSGLLIFTAICFLIGSLVYYRRRRINDTERTENTSTYERMSEDE